MGERDPFGREKGEDSLKEMGWTLPSAEPAAASTAAPEPSAAATGLAAPSDAASAPSAPAAPSAPPRAPRAPRPRRRGGGIGVLLLRAVIPIAVIAGIGAAVLGSVRTGGSSGGISIPNIAIPKLNIPSTPTQPAKPAKPPAGLGAGSLLRPAGIGAAMARLRPLGRPYILRLAADRIDAQVVRGANLRIVHIGSDGSFTRTDVTGVGRSLGTFSWSDVDPGGPERMIRTTGRRPSSVNYLVLGSFGAGVRLSLYLTSGTYYSADAHGRGVQRLG